MQAPSDGDDRDVIVLGSADVALLIADIDRIAVSDLPAFDLFGQSAGFAEKTDITDIPVEYIHPVLDKERHHIRIGIGGQHRHRDPSPLERLQYFRDVGKGLQITQPLAQFQLDLTHEEGELVKG